MLVMKKDYVVCPLSGHSLCKGSRLRRLSNVEEMLASTVLPSGGTTLLVCGTGDSHADYKVVVFFASR